MFREKLKKDLSGISPDGDLLSKVTKAMQEEAAKPRQPKHTVFMRFAGMAAAVCMIAVGTVALKSGSGIELDTAAKESAQVDETDAYNLDKFVGAADACSEADESPVTTTESMMYCDETMPDAAPAEEEPLQEETAGETDAIAPAEEIKQESAFSEEGNGITLPDDENDYKASEVNDEIDSAPRVLTGGKVLYEGTEYSPTDSELEEIGSIVENYTKENTHRITSRVITDEEIAEYEKSGLALTLFYDDGSEVYVFADKENAYICGESTFHLGDGVHAQIIAFVEAVRLKKMFSL